MDKEKQTKARYADMVDLELSFLLQQISKMMEAHVHKLMVCKGFEDIRPAQYQVFENLRLPGMTVSKLARLAGLSKQSMTIFVEALRERGYLKLEESKWDKRVRRVFLTGKGRRAQGMLRKCRIWVEHTVCREMEDDGYETIWCEAMRLFDLLVMGR